MCLDIQQRNVTLNLKVAQQFSKYEGSILMSKYIDLYIIVSTHSN